MNPAIRKRSRAMSRISDLVKLKTGYANFVELKTAFEESQQNADRMAMYRPTTAHRRAFERLCRGLYQPNDKKFYLLSGSYGTGKSHLCLMYANALSRSSGDSEIKGFYDNYGKLDPDAAKLLRNIRKGGQYLVAICDYHSGRRFEDVVLKAVSDACKAKGLDVGVETEFDEAERQLEDWESKAGDTAAIRDHYEDFSRAVEQIAPGLTVGQLRTGLREYDSGCLEQFRGAYKLAQGGTDFQARSGNLIPIVQKLVRSKAFRDRFQGLAIIFDEFGFTLEKAAYSKDVLQGFMETICKNEPNVVFVGCIHKDFKAYADRFSKDDASVMSARITSVDLLNEGIEEIIGAIVEIEKGGAVWASEVAPKLGVLDALLPVCETLKLFPWIPDTQHIRQRVLEDIYGVHPAALAALLRLSSEVGSDARSTFTFFSGDVGGAQGSYAEYIGENDLLDSSGKLNLYTVDRLFSFFQDELSPKNAELRDAQRQIVNGYVASVDALRKAGQDQLVNEREAEQTAILRTILIYQLVRIATTLENIQFGLYALLPADKKGAEANLKALEKMGAVFFRQQSKTYELAVGTGVDPYELVNRYLGDSTKYPTDTVDAFLAEAGEDKDPLFLDAKQYNLAYGEDKRFRSVFIRAKDLSEQLWEQLKKEQIEAASKPTKSYEGVAVYALCEDEAEIQVAREAVQDIPWEDFVVGVPHEPHPFTEMLLRVRACRHALDPQSEEKLNAQTESRLRDMFENPQDGYLPALQSVFRQIAGGELACWYSREGKVVVDQPKQPHRPVDTLCDRMFLSRCKIQHTDLNNVHDDRWRTEKNNALKQAVNTLLGAERIQIDNGNPDNHGEKRYLERVLLKGAGGLRKTDSDGPVTFFACESDPDKIDAKFPVLKDLCERLSNLDPGETLAVGTFINAAKGAPCGAGGTALMLALGHAVRAYGERLRVFKDSTRTSEYPLQDYGDLSGLVADPATGVVLEVREITGNQAKLIDAVAGGVGAPPVKHGEIRSLNETFELLDEWWRGLPVVARITGIYAQTHKEGLERFRTAFDTIGSSDRYEFLLDVLPGVYLETPPGTALTEDDVNVITQAFSDDVKLLNTGYHIVTKMVAEAVSELFGEKGDLVQCRTSVVAWHEALTPRQREALTYQDSPEAASLMQVLGDPSVTFEDGLMRRLPMDYGLDEIREWNALHVEDYTAKLVQALEDVKAAAVVIAPPEIETQGSARKIGPQKYELGSGAGILLKIPKGAGSIVYTTTGTDPRGAEDRVTIKKDTDLVDTVSTTSVTRVSARALDGQGNFSDLVSFAVIYKPLEYKPVFNDKKDDLFVREAHFKIPETAEDLRTVLKGIVAESIKLKIITKKKAEKLLSAMDEI
jgi:hypothetical protein